MNLEQEAVYFGLHLASEGRTWLALAFSVAWQETQALRVMSPASAARWQSDSPELWVHLPSHPNLLSVSETAGRSHFSP